MSSARSSAEADEHVLRASYEAAASVVRAAQITGSISPVILIDGRSGAGKSTLASSIASLWPGHGRLQIVALDSLYPGWDGLEAGVEIARRDILVPHARGATGVWRRFDWESGTVAEPHAVDPALPLVVEGSGVLTPKTAPLADVRVWVEAPDAVRKDRALARDGETYRPHWQRWAQQEEAHLVRDSPSSLATHRIEMG